MPKDFEHQAVMVIDQGGLYCHVAEKLAEQFGACLYWCEWRTAFPYSGKAMIGMGLPGVTRVRYWMDHIDDADLIVFSDVYGSADQEFLRKRLGKRVWGSGGADALELYRGDLKNILRQVSLPVAPYVEIVGMAALREYLQKNDDVFIKASLFRGDCETFHSPNYTLSQGHLDDMASHLGPRQETIRFICEKRISGPEFGFDGTCILGEFSDIVAWGYEHKDKQYLGQICAYDSLPVEVRLVNAQLAPLLRELDMRGAWSWEARKFGKEIYVVDPCARFGSPPSEVYIEAYQNWSQHIWHGAEGKVENLEPKGRFMAEIILRSGRTEKSFMAVQFPEDFRHLVKLHGHFIQDGVDYVAPLGIREFGAAVGVADTEEEAKSLALEVAKSVEADDVEFEENWDGCEAKVREGVEAGIEW